MILQNPAVLYPAFALASWTFIVLMLIPFYRIRAGQRREIRTEDFKYGESATVPGYVSIPNRNYMNLLELPILFYIVCILFFITGNVSSMAITLAWVYVALRVIHSLIHLGYNNVLHRLAAFALSNVALIALWIVAAQRIIAA